MLLNDVSLLIVEEVKDLGVIIDSRLVLTIHIKQAVVRAELTYSTNVLFLVMYSLFTRMRAFKV